MSEDELELIEAAKWRPGDHWAAIWPSDIERNISADARLLAKKASQAFRKALRDSDRHREADETGTGSVPVGDRARAAQRHRPTSSSAQTTPEDS